MEAFKPGSNGVLRTNLAADTKSGTAQWFTHFLDLPFAESAGATVGAIVGRSYRQDRRLNVAALGAGEAFYEGELCRGLHKSGWRPVLFVSDLQPAALQRVQQHEFPVNPVQSDATRLPFVDANQRPPEHQVLVASRAVEHYLSSAQQIALVQAAARILHPGEYYLPQLSSGKPAALTAFSTILTDIAGKREAFLSEDDYRQVLRRSVGKNGRPLFEETGVGYAKPQPRDTGDLARRYLTPFFVDRYERVLDRQSAPYRASAGLLLGLREELGRKIATGEINREQALGELDANIRVSDVYRYFSSVVEAAARRSTNGHALTENNGLSFGPNGTVSLNIEYPIFALERTDERV